MKYLVKIALGLFVYMAVVASCKDDDDSGITGFSIDKEDIKYMTLANTLQSTMDEKGRMMESTLPVPAVLDWLGVSFPLEATRGSGSGAYKCSKLDGLSYFQNYTGSFAWYGTFLGNYQQDLEWRDYE